MRKELEELDMKLTEKNINVYPLGNTVQYKNGIAFLTLMSGLESGLYVFPKYQRINVNKDDVLSLVSSFVSNSIIHTIYAYRNKEGKMEILEGQKVLLYLYFYFKGVEFDNKELEIEKVLRNENNSLFNLMESISKEYKLINIEYKLHHEKGVSNVTYDKLDKETRNLINMRTLSFVEVKVSDDNKKVLYKNFEGFQNKEFSKQDLRNSIYDSEFYDMLYEFESKINDKMGENVRNREILLRLCASDYYTEVEKGILKFKNDFKTYSQMLNDFSNVAVSFSEEEIIKYEQKLDEFFSSLGCEFRVPFGIMEALFLLGSKVKINDEVIVKIISEMRIDDINNIEEMQDYLRFNFNVIYKFIN